MAKTTYKAPEWNNPGVEPPQEFKDMGWRPGYKPPAQYLNWYMNQTYIALREMQEIAGSDEALNAIMEHASNETIHITKEERDSWNEGVDTANAAVPLETATSVIPTATENRNGLLSKEDKAKINYLVEQGEYELPEATSEVLGGVKLGGNVDMDNGYLNVSTASSGNYGVVKLGGNVEQTEQGLSIRNASSVQAGVVKLNDSLDSTSITEAATANAVRQLKELINEGGSGSGGTGMTEEVIENITQINTEITNITENVTNIEENITNIEENITEVTELVESVGSDISDHLADFMAHNVELNQTSTDPDGYGFYQTVTYTRPGGSKYLVSSASEPDSNGYYTRIVWQFYDENNTLKLTKTWTLIYDENGIATSKAVI